MGRHCIFAIIIPWMKAPIRLPLTRSLLNSLLSEVRSNSTYYPIRCRVLWNHHHSLHCIIHTTNASIRWFKGHCDGHERVLTNLLNYSRTMKISSPDTHPHQLGGKQESKEFFLELS